MTGKVAVMIRQADIRTELVSVLGSSALLGARQKRRPAEWQTCPVGRSRSSSPIKSTRNADRRRNPLIRRRHICEGIGSSAIIAVRMGMDLPFSVANVTGITY
jgi:hypothetical protein